MDFAEPAGADALRDELAAFLAEQLPPPLVEDIYRTGVAHDAGFVKALVDRGWVAPDLQDESPLDMLRYKVVRDGLLEAEAPILTLETTMMVARVIRAVGSEELRADVLPGALRGDITIALGMSEPEAGSDVAAVQTRARRDGEEWVIDGSKMFTTGGHLTDYVFLLARTDPTTANHRGLTTFLVPMDHPGVEAHAVHTLGGERTNITYYDGVRLHDRWRIGEVDGGWGALMVALQEEHSAAFAPHLVALLEATEAWATAPSDGDGPRPIDRPLVRDALARAATDLEVAQLLDWRSACMDTAGEVPVVEGPMSKLFSTEALVRHAERIAEVAGPDALRSRLDPTALADGRIEHTLRFSLGTTIYAGTSEVQRNIIAQRGLGLPR